MPTAVPVVMDPEARAPLDALKRTKNAIVGNPTAKSALAADGATVPVIVDHLNPDGSDDDTIVAVRIEAAHVVASLAVGSQLALQALLASKAHQALFYALSSLSASSPSSLRTALARALRAVGVATAEAVGPSLWQLGPDNTLARESARIALEDFFHIAALDVYLPLLVDSSQQVVVAICGMLASLLRVHLHRLGVSEWLPPADRAKEQHKAKRGWEKPDVKPNAPRRQGGWVARTLVALLKSEDRKLREAALGALAAVCRDNPLVSTALTKPGQVDSDPPLTTIVALAKSRNVEIQISACLCATHALRAQVTSLPPVSHSNPLIETHILTILHVLNQLISQASHDPSARSRACFILCALVTDRSDYEQIAADCGSLTIISNVLVSITPDNVEWDDEEAASSYILREAVLTAATSLTLHAEASRQTLAEKADVMAALRASLQHPEVGVRHAACQAVRAITRSVNSMRTAVVDAGLGPKLFDIVSKPDEDRRVRIASLAAMCNLITTEHSPARAELIERGGIDCLVALVKSQDEGMCVNAAWAIANCLYKGTYEEKHMVMEKLGWDTLNLLLESSNDELREQGISIVKNFATAASVWTPEGVVLVQGLGKERLLACLESILSASNENLVCKGFEALLTLSKGKYDDDPGFCRPSLLACLRTGLLHTKVGVRRAASHCVSEMVLAYSKRVKDFRDAGIESTLRNMYGPGSLSMLTAHHISHLSWQQGMEDDVEVRKQVCEALIRIGYRDAADHGEDAMLDT